MEILCSKCGHSINEHCLGHSSDGSSAGYCTHYDSNGRIFCPCQKSANDVATTRLELVEQAVLEYMEVSTFESGIFGCIYCDINFIEPSKHLHNCEWRIKYDALLSALNTVSG